MLFQETGINREFEHVIFVCLLGSFLASYQVNLYMDEGESQGRRRGSWNWKLLWQREGKGWLGWEEGEFLDPCCSFWREFLSLSLLPAFFVSINRFCLCGSFVEGCPAGRVPSLIGMCHSAEGKINRWPFLASPLLPALINTFICILSLWL